jgi:hypothetical protein
MRMIESLSPCHVCNLTTQPLLAKNKTHSRRSSTKGSFPPLPPAEAGAGSILTMSLAPSTRPRHCDWQTAAAKHEKLVCSPLLAFAVRAGGAVCPEQRSREREGLIKTPLKLPSIKDGKVFASVHGHNWPSG